MNDTPSTQEAGAGASREEVTSALFANLVLQQTNMALMLLGKAPHPESGETLSDPEGARMFIDQLEMLEAKTRGNLSKEEAGLLKQSLMAVRLAFVETVDAVGKAPTEHAAGAGEPARAAAPGQHTESPSSAPAAEDESRKRFVKKY